MGRGVGGVVTWSPHPPHTHLINSQRGKKAQMGQSPGRICATILKLIHIFYFVWMILKKTKDTARGTILWDHVGSVNLMPHEPDKIMTESFSLSHFFIKSLGDWWVLTVIVQWGHMKNNCNIDCKLLCPPPPFPTQLQYFAVKGFAFQVISITTTTVTLLIWC